MSLLDRLFIGLVLLAVVQVSYYFPQVPGLMASHFDARGVPNGWSSRNLFFGIYLAILIMMIGVFFILPRWSRWHIGFSRKIPHRDYWLAAERRQQTQAFFQQQMIIMGTVHLLLAIYIVQLALVANLAQPIRLHSSTRWVLGIYFILLIAWLIHFWRHFRKT